MSTQVQFRRGTTAQHTSFTGADGEMTIDTTKKTVVVHDGSTAGGFPSITEAGGTITGNLSVTGTVDGRDLSVDGLKLDGVEDNANRKNKNAVINGNFDIWQRGSSATGSGFNADDRWRNLDNGSTKVTSRQTFALGQTDVPNNPTYYSRTVVTSVAGVSNYVFKQNKIEYASTLAGEEVTLSFWAKADSAKDIATEFSRNYGSGGTPSASDQEIGVTTHSLTTSWQKFTTTTTLPSISGKTLGTDGSDHLNVNFWFDAGSDDDARTNSLGQQSGTFDIAQVQLEKGDSATDFEMRSVGEELALCQRYYEIIKYPTSGVTPYAMMSALLAVNSWHLYYYRVVKRTTPTFIIISGGIVGDIDYYAPGIDHYVFGSNSSFYLSGTNGNTACAFDAEL